jgi:hypothetical protein
MLSSIGSDVANREEIFPCLNGQAPRNVLAILEPWMGLYDAVLGL